MYETGLKGFTEKVWANCARPSLAFIEVFKYLSKHSAYSGCFGCVFVGLFTGITHNTQNEMELGIRPLLLLLLQSCALNTLGLFCLAVV